VSRSSARSDRSLRALPWLLLLQVGVVVGQRIGELSAKDRARLSRLLRDSRGWPGRLGVREREELRKLVGKVDPKAMSRELLPLLQGARRGRKRR
jgi:hypothetical protein